MIDREYFEQKYPHIVSELHKVYDPEIPLDIFELGLIYNIELNEDDSVDIVMKFYNLVPEVKRVLGLQAKRYCSVYLPDHQKELLF